MSFFVWFQFALVCTIGAMSPGPSLAVIIQNNVNYNRLAGIMTSVGHGIGIGANLKNYIRFGKHFSRATI